MHASRWPWVTLLACAAASGGAGAQGVAPSDAGVTPPAPPAVEGEEEPAREWRLPPLRLNGSLSYETRVTRGSGEPNSVSHTVTGTVGTSTYIYQPWLATLSGTLGLSTSVSRSSAPTVVTGPFNDSEIHDHLRGRENFVTGSARLDLFPRSRFPAEVHIERQDSRVDTGLASPIAFTRQNIGVSMRYRPESGLYNLVGSYAHNDQWGTGFRSSQDSVSGDFTTHWKYNELGLGGNFSRARSEGFDDESRFSGLVARHTYTPSNELSVSSTANLTRTEDRGGVAHSDLQVMQLSSVALYHPERSPLTLTGSVRGLLLRDREAGSGNDSYGATLGANYEVSPNLRLTANGGANFNRSDAGDSHSFAGAVGANYQGDTLEWRKFQYNWFAGATAGAAVATSTQLGTLTDQNLGLQLGHSVGRSWPLSSQSNLSLNATQSVSVSHSTSSREELGSGLGTVKSLLNSVAASWQQSGDGQNAFARVSYSDSAELGGGHARFQLFNFQLSGNMDLGYGRSLTGDLTYQRTAQRASDLLAAGDAALGLRTRSSGAAGEITFRQNKLFGIQRLRFSSRVRLAQDVLHQPGQLLSIPDRETRLWENRLDWSIGRLETQLVLRISKIDGNRIDSLWLRVQRTFGD